MVKDREAWRAAVRGVTKRQTQFGNWTTTIVNKKEGRKLSEVMDMFTTQIVVMASLLSKLIWLYTCLVTQSCTILCNPMDYSPPGSSVHGISQARMLEWVAISFSRASSWPRDRIPRLVSPALQEDSLPTEPLGRLYNYIHTTNLLYQSYSSKVA